MHAIAQSERDGPRASLWTGDLGVALYLQDLLDGRDAFPTLGPFAGAGSTEPGKSDGAGFAGAGAGK